MKTAMDLARWSLGLAGVSFAATCFPADQAKAAEFVGNCQPYVGQSLTPQTFDEAVSRFSASAPKGEFETTAQYQSRVGSTEVGPLLIVAKELEDQKYLPYDADAGQLRILSYAFDNTGFQAWDAFYSAKISEPAAATFGNIDVVISESDVIAGTYEAQNALGAKWNVTKTERTTKAIFQRRGTPTEDLFLNTGAGRTIGVMEMTPNEAMLVRPTLKIAFAVKPKPPYVVASKYLFGKTTVSNPREITVSATVLIADIHCGLLLNEQGKVVGAYEAQGLKASADSTQARGRSTVR